MSAVTTTHSNAPDLVATIFSVAGVKHTEGLHGHDLTPLLKNPHAEWPHACLYEYTGEHDGMAKLIKAEPTKAVYQKVPWCAAAVKDGGKYIRYLQPNVPEELYDPHHRSRRVAQFDRQASVR